MGIHGRAEQSRTWMAIVIEDLVLVDGLDLDSRDAFVASVTEAINAAAGSSDGPIRLDCSKVKGLDEGTLGMLGLVARSAQRRGTRVALAHASTRLRAELQTGGIGHFFDDLLDLVVSETKPRVKRHSSVRMHESTKQWP
jgi:anti-anti-sigma regulatory factor